MYLIHINIHPNQVDYTMRLLGGCIYIANSLLTAAMLQSPERKRETAVAVFAYFELRIDVCPPFQENFHRLEVAFIGCTIECGNPILSHKQ